MLKQILPLALIFAILSSAHAAAGVDVSTAVLQAEQARVAALIADDYIALDRLLSDDLTYAHSSTFVDSKASFMASLTSGRLKYKELEHHDQRVRVYGDTAVITGTTRVYSIAQGQDVRLNLRFMIVYVKQSDQWRMVAWQSTRIP